MSGIEVTGVVLGALPLLVSGLARYAEGLETIGRWWRYKRSAAHLARILDAEWGRFQGTAEKLLDGLVSGTELEHLIHDPGGSLWKNKDLDRKLKRKLGRDYRRYFRCVVAMEEAINDLWSRLELDDYGQPQWGNFYSFKHHYKRIRASLSHRKYERALSKITDNNDLLACLLEQNVQAEPSRRRRRRPRLEFSTIQQQARSLYDCLDRDCNCDLFHETELRLDVRLGSEHRDDIFSMHIGYLAYSDEQSDNPCWHEFEIRTLGSETERSERKQSNLDSSKKTAKQPHSVGTKFFPFFSGKPADKGRKKSVKFSGISDPPEKVQKSDQRLTESFRMSTNSSSAARIDFLCLEAQRLASLRGSTQSEIAAQKLLGVLRRKDASQAKIGVFIPSESHRGIRRDEFKSLTSLLNGKHARKKDTLHLALGNLSLGHGERLMLALTIASSILQLYDTRWLNELWDRSCIMVDVGQPCNNRRFPRVFIRRAFPEEPEERPEQALIPFVILNPVIYNLGLVLIEICLGRSLESFRNAEDPLDSNGRPNVLTNLSTAMRLMDHIYSVAGDRYGDAVRRCIRSDFDSRSTDLNEEAFRQAVYEKVVEPLEEDVKNFYCLE